MKPEVSPKKGQGPCGQSSHLESSVPVGQLSGHVKSPQRVHGCGMHSTTQGLSLPLGCSVGRTAVTTVRIKSSDCRGGAHPQEGRLDDDLTGKLVYGKSWREQR